MKYGRRIGACAAALALLLALGTAPTAAAEDMDPLLRLLVAKGILTQEEAAALQAESDSMEKSQGQEAQPAAEKAPAEAAKKKSWTDRVAPSGDIRLRYEGFSQDGSFDDGQRDRYRIRLRAGARFTVTDWMKVGVQLRTGDPADPVSANTTFSDAFSSKGINLSEGYLEIRPTKRFGFAAGKFDPKKWWTVTDLQWDDDVTVEGLMTNTGLVHGDGAFKGLDLVAYIYSLEENKNGPDAYTYGGQLRSKFKMAKKNSLEFGVGYDQWSNPQLVADLTLDGELKGNKVTNFLDVDDQLISDFEILNVFAGYKNTSNDRWPVSVKLYYYKNSGAKGIGSDNDTGYFGRVQVGDYKQTGQLCFRYTYYYSEPDAMFYVFTQSDTSRGSNVEAHRFDFRIGFFARSYFNITWYNTREAFGDDETLNRWQMDYIVKF